MRLERSTLGEAGRHTAEIAWNTLGHTVSLSLVSLWVSGLYSLSADHHTHTLVCYENSMAKRCQHSVYVPCGVYQKPLPLKTSDLTI